MIYSYECEKCDEEHEIVKPAEHYNRPEACPRCGFSLNKIFSTFQFFGAKNEDPEYNHGLGQVIKNKRERKEIAKQKGLIEVGNESVESLHKHATLSRQEKLKRSWDEVET
jgi:putative FmdB family regulatory protein